MTEKSPSEVGLFVFRQSQVQPILEGLGLSVRNGLVHDSQGRRKRFFCCDKDANVKHLGRIMPGSLELICDDPICFNQYAVTLVSD